MDENNVENTWSIPFKQGVVDYCSLVVWRIGGFGGLVESSIHNRVLCGGLPTPRMDFQWLVIVSCDGCNSGALARTIASCGWQVDEIESSSGRRVVHCRGVIVYEVFDPGG